MKSVEVDFDLSINLMLSQELTGRSIVMKGRFFRLIFSKGAFFSFLSDDLSKGEG